MAKIATGHLRLLWGVHVSTCECMILGSAFGFFVLVLYCRIERQSSAIGGTCVLFLYHCCSSVCHFPMVAHCKISERESRKKHMTG